MTMAMTNTGNTANLRYRRAGRQRWLLQSSMIAAAVAMASFAAAQQARAQAVPSVAPRANGTVTAQGTPTVANGTVNINRGATRDQVEVTTPQAIINWQTFDTATVDSTTDYVNFLPAGTELEFIGAGSDYTVLNRIFSTPNASGVYRGIAFEGTVTSRLSDAGPIGGNIWFYSPGGILVSSGGVFNVGSLVLTTSDLASIDSGGSVMNFGGVSQADSSIIIEGGASISALNDGSYVAMFAPRVQQSGTVTVNGSVAYVGAEQGQLTINNGLFDIAITVGSEDANGVVHDGTTTGPASVDTIGAFGSVTDADNQAIYLVAVPKNDAITMLVGGDIGYQPAASASQGTNGEIILSAGANVSTRGSPLNPQVTVDTANAVSNAGISFGAGQINSDLTAYASGDLNMVMTNGDSLTSGSDTLGGYSVDLTSDGTLNFGAEATSSLDFAGDVTLRAGSDQARGGTINVVAAGDPAGILDPGTINVGGDLTLDANARGRDDFFIIRNNGNTGIGEDAVAGSVSITTRDQGIITVGGNLTVDTTAQGGKGESQNGSATAGDITLTILSGSLNVTGLTDLNAGTISTLDGKIGGNGPGLIGSDGIGGNVTLNLAGGNLNLGAVAITTDGVASTGSSSASAQSNDGIAGNVSINVTGGSHTIDFLSVSSDAVAAESYDEFGTSIRGLAQRGSVNIAVSNTDSALLLSSGLDISATTRGATTDPTSPTVSLSARDTGTSGGFTVLGDIFIDTGAGRGSDDVATTAGSVDITVDSSSFSFDTLFIDAVAAPSGFSFGTIGEGLDFVGGDITLTVQNGGIFTGNSMFLDASGTGADGTAGNGTGGTITVLVDNASFNVSGTSSLDSSGRGGTGGDVSDPTSLGIGQGGVINVTVRGAGGFMSLGSLFASSDGSIFFDVEGGSGTFEGDGGIGIGGDVIFNIEGGTFTANRVRVSADGEGGPGGELVTRFLQDLGKGGVSGFELSGLDGVQFAGGAIGDALGFTRAGDGGAGTGGNVTFNLNGGTATVTNLSVTADGIGGDGATGYFDNGTTGGNGGVGTGGTAIFNALTGTLTVTNTLTVSANGNSTFGGGDGGFGVGTDGGQAGAGFGGTALFDLNGTATINAGTLIVSADGFGGRGGSTGIDFDPFGEVRQAGLGGNGGTGTAGSATFNHTSGTITFGNLEIRADGAGGEGGDVFGLSLGLADNNGGAGGDAVGGTATMNLNQDDASNPTYNVYARATGGDGGDGLTSGDGGDATGGTAQLLVNNANVVLTSASVDSSGTGGTPGFVDGENGNGGAGGDGTGGTSRITVSGVNGNLSALFPFNATSDGFGGRGADAAQNQGDVDPSGTGGAGGAGTGGLVEITAITGATFDYSADGVTSAQGIGGAGGQGGNAPFFDAGAGGAAGAGNGGAITFSASGGSTLNVDGNGSDNQFNANGIGGVGGDGGIGLGSVVANPGQNGAASGGAINLLASGAGSVLAITGNVIADASGTGNLDLRDNALGADATGGSFTSNASAGGTISISGGLSADATARASAGVLGAGNAIGGSIDFLMSGVGSNFEVLGQFSAAFPLPLRQRSIYADASAHEPQSGNPLLQSATGGDTTGGRVNVNFADGTSTIASRVVFEAGAGEDNPLSGTGALPGLFVDSARNVGGAITINLTGSTNNWGSLDASVTTFGFGGEAVQGTIGMVLDNATLNLTNFGLSLDTYTAGEITVNDPVAVSLQVLNGSTLTANTGISLFSDTGLGVTNATVQAGGVEMLVDASTVTVSSDIFLGNEAQAFRFPSVTSNTTGADALAGDLTFSATNGSTINGDVQLWSFAIADAGPSSGNAQSGALNYTLTDSQHIGTGVGAAIDTISFAEALGAIDAGGTAGNAVTGDTTITISGASTFTGNIDLENSFANYYNTGAELGGLGSGTGGTMTVNLLGGTITIGQIQVANNFGAEQAAIGQAGSDQFGGDFVLNVANAAVTIGTLDINTSVTGGDGGDGGILTPGANGGAGTAGDILIDVDPSATLALTSASLIAAGSGGVGGSGAPGGTGGTGTGGTIDFSVGGTGTLLSGFSGLDANASGTGGAGGVGVEGDTSVAGTQGGTGGSGQGGTARLAINGVGATLTVDPSVFQLVADGIGGTGGAGGSNLSGGNAGNGGTGGDGRGGAVELVAGSGSTLDLTPTPSPSPTGFSLSSSGTGGTGGQGGSIDMLSGGAAGAGGDGGNGIGGAPTLRAAGGTIVGADLALIATGTGGNGGIGGDDGASVLGATGNGGDGQGGNPILEILDGSPGILSFDNVSIFANGVAGSGTLSGATLGGRVDLIDASPDPLGLMDFGTLTVDATGLSAAPGGGFYMTGGSGPTTVAGQVFVDVAGDIVFAFDGDGQLVAGGGVTLNAGGDILVTHTNNAGSTVSIDAGGSFSATSVGRFTADSGSFIASGNELFIIAGGDITADDLTAVPVISLTSEGSVFLNNALATGPQGVSNFAGIIINAGLIAAGSPVYDPAANVEITGTVESYRDIVITAGGSTSFVDGSQTTADNALIVRTGDDIIVESGASIASAANPTDAIDLLNPFASGPNIQLLAGSVTNLLSPILTPIASVVVDGEINSGDAATIITGNAVDALDGSISAASLAVDINDAPANGVVPSDDGGLLSANCLEGNVCLGNILATNSIEIGQASNNDVIQLIVQQGTVSAREILITTRRDIVMGTNGIATQLDASDLFSLESSEGNVDLRDASIFSNQILIDAAGSLIGSAQLNSVNDIGITVGSNIQAGSIESGGQLTTVANVGGALEGAYSVPGSMDVGLLSIASGPVRIIAGGDILLGEVVVASQDISLNAPGDVALGFTDTAVNVTIVGGSLDIGTITASNDIVLSSASDIGLTSVDAGSNVTLVAGTSITGGNLAAGGFIDASASNGDAAFGTVAGGSFISLTTTAGSLTTGDVSTTGSGSQVSLRAGGANSDLTAGNMLSNGGDILINAGGNISLASAATGALPPTSGSIVLVAGGSVTSSGNLSAGEDIAVAAVGDATLASLSAGDDVVVDAGGAISLASATAIGTGPDIFSIALDTASAGQPGAIAFASETAELAGSNVVLTSGTDTSVTTTVGAANAITIVAGGTPSIGNAVSGGDTSVTGQSITFNNGTVGGNLTLNATNGAIDGNGTVTVSGGIDFDATGNVGFGSLNAQGGSFTVDAGGDITFTAATSSDFIAMVAGGEINGGDLSAVNSLSLQADAIAIGDASAANISLLSARDILFNLLSSPNSISLTASNGVIAANGGAGDIQSGGDVTITALAIALGDIVSGGSISATAGIGNVSLGTITAVGDITLDANQHITVEHAEAQGNFLATSGLSFTTGLNSITTGGNIIITAGGVVNLGNSTAGGFIDVSGTQVDFVALVAGLHVQLVATAPDTAGPGGTGTKSGPQALVPPVATPGTGSVAGTSITAGTGASSLTANGGDIQISGAVTSTGSMAMTASAGNIALGGTASAGGDLSLDASGLVTMVDADAGGAMDITAGSSVSAGALNAGSDLIVRAFGGEFIGTTLDAGGDVSVDAFGNINFATARAGNDVDLDSFNGGSITVGSLFANSEIIVNSDGTFTADTLDATGTGAGAIDVDAAGDITIGSLIGRRADISAATGSNLRIETEVDLTQELIATADDIFIRATQDLEVNAFARNGGVDIETVGALSTVGVSATQDIRLVSTGSSVAVNDEIVIDNVTPGKGASPQQVTTSGGNILISAAGDVVVNANVTATDTLTIQAGGLADIQAAAIGETIDLFAADIAIGSTGSLGQTDLTNLIRIGTDGDMRIGGAGGASGLFELDNAEFSRVHSGGDIEIAADNGFIELDDLDIVVIDNVSGPQTGNLGQTGTLDFFSQDGIDVFGAVVMTNATADNRLSLATELDVFIDANTGLLEINEDTGVYTGTLAILAENVFAMTPGALADISGLGAADIDSRLADSEGIDNPDGLLRAGTGDIVVSQSFLVQNTAPGTDFADRRGFTFDSLLVQSNTAATGASIVVVINGIVNGQTGVDAIAVTDFTGATLDALSTLNGCLIADPSSCVTTTTPNDDSPGDPLQDLIEDQFDDDPGQDDRTEQGFGDKFDTMLIELRDPTDYDEEPLIDDPVTGAGNEDLWSGGEEECEEGDETCPA
ncbi:MAG: hypothetical protein H6918_07610 [Sphingomonadaceae bacterium]|nr:hypothetical protein [Sphingomonadaceae bacterium]